MPAENGDYVKVFLYLLRRSGAGETLSPDALARHLQLDSAAVEAALSYWVRRDVMSQTPEGYSFRHLTTAALTPQKGENAALEAQLAHFKQFNRELQEIFENRILKPEEYQRAQDWTDLPGSGLDLVLWACRYGVARSKSGRKVAFGYIERTLNGWLHDGLSAADARARAEQAQKADSGAVIVLRRLGETTRFPSRDEEILYNKWTGKWGFTPEAVLAACAQTTAARTPSFAYLDRILANLVQTGENVSGKEELKSWFTAKKEKLLEICQVFDALGLLRRVTPKDQELYEKWRGDWAFSQEIVLLAAGESADAKQPLKYCDTILKNWREEGIATAGAARKRLAERPAAEQKGPVKAIDALQFAQREYSDEDLRKRIMQP